MIDELFQNLNSLHHQTALLEACDWDEGRVEYLIGLVTERLRDADPSTPLEEHIENALREDTTPAQLKAITELIMVNARQIWKTVIDPHHWN
jgi:hypothetical protein